MRNQNGNQIRNIEDGLTADGYKLEKEEGQQRFFSFTVKHYLTSKLLYADQTYPTTIVKNRERTDCIQRNVELDV